MVLKENIWKGKRVLVTGHTGFKGAWLVYILNELGAEVIGLSLPPDLDNQNLYTDARIAKKLTYEYLIDIRIEKDVIKVLEWTNPDYVFHLAAKSLVLNSIKSPLDTISTNIMGTVHVLLTSLKLKSVKGILISTTDKVYKNLDSHRRYIESDNLGGNEPYSASKAASEILITALTMTQNIYSIPVTTVRAGNVIGGGDWGVNRLIPDVIRSFSSGSTLKIRNPQATRPWQYVLDCLRGYLIIGESHFKNRNETPKSINLGPEVSLSVRELVRIFESTFKIKFDFEPGINQIFESKYLEINSLLASESLGWSPLLTTKMALEKTADWYLNFLRGQDAQDLMYSDIYSYGLEKFTTLSTSD
jgi:CDP-glucose 4,6-dehydratase